VRPASFAAPDQVDRANPVSPVDRTAPVSSVEGTDDRAPTITLLALIALALAFAGIGFASWLAVSRKRSRATI